MPTRAEMLAGLAPPTRQGLIETLRPANTPWEWSKPTYQTGRSYDRSTLTFRDGKFYSGDTEVGANDRVTWQDTSIYDGDNGGVQMSRPIWTFNNVGEVLNSQKQITDPNSANWQYDGETWHRPTIDNPDYAAHSTTANPLRGDPTKNFMSSSARDMLYGVKASQYGRQALDISKWDGTEAYSDDFRSKWGASNATVVKEMLRQLYPNATEQQLDDAALKAFQSDRTVDQIWYGKYRPQTRKAGTSYDVQDSPVSIVKNIAKQLGGLTPQQEQALTRYDQEKLLPYMKQWEDGVDAYDDSNRGITGFLNDIGPAKYLALLAGPPGATALAVAQAGSSLERGDLRGAIANGIGAYLSYNSPTPTANPSMESIATNAVKNIPRSAALQYLATGKVDPKSLAIGAGANIVGGVIGSQVGGAMSDPAFGQRFGQAATGLINYGVRQNMRGSPPVQASRTTNTQTQPQPPTQPRSSWGRMPTVGASRVDMLKTLTGG